MLKKLFCPSCLIGLVLVLAVIGGYFLLSGAYRSPTPEVTPQEEGALPPTGSTKEFTVSGNEFNFSPASITVSAGEQVKITFRNDGRAPHNLVIEGLGVTTRTIGGGQTDTVEFTAPTSGTYIFFCSVSGHRAAGMEGSLEVK